MSKAVLLMSSTVTNEVDKVRPHRTPVRSLWPGCAGRPDRLAAVGPANCCAHAQVRQRKLVASMESKKVRFVEVDGSDPEQKDMRSTLFDISGLRGKYPQVFLQDAGNHYSFVGDWDEFEGLLDSDGLPPNVLKENPGIKTFTTVFSCCIAA